MLKRLLRGVWRGVLPVSARTWVKRSPTLSRWKQTATRGLLRHDDVYDAAYYASVEQTASESAGPMVATILRDLVPTSVLDVGCGTGAFLACLQSQGVPAHGLEYSADGLARCRARGVEAAAFDLEHDTRVGDPAHVVVSLEVAEHLDARFADRYADCLAQHVAPGGWLVFTAATPGQGGKGHVNEQPHRYWIQKMRVRGLDFHLEHSLRWRAEWNGRVAPWYSANLMLFHRQERATSGVPSTKGSSS